MLLLLKNNKTPAEARAAASGAGALADVTPGLCRFLGHNATAYRVRRLGLEPAQDTVESAVALDGDVPAGLSAEAVKLALGSGDADCGSGAGGSSHK